MDNIQVFFWTTGCIAGIWFIIKNYLEVKKYVGISKQRIIVYTQKKQEQFFQNCLYRLNYTPPLLYTLGSKAGRIIFLLAWAVAPLLDAVLYGFSLRTMFFITTALAVLAYKEKLTQREKSAKREILYCRYRN